jgi:hypothetical protein
LSFFSAAPCLHHFELYAIGHEIGDFRNHLVKVMRLEEDGRVAQVEVDLVVFGLHDFMDAQVAPNLLGYGLREQVFNP